MERETVAEELRLNKEGYTISELASRLKTSRNTIANIFAFFEGAEKVSIRKAGMAKIYYWKARSTGKTGRTKKKAGKIRRNQKHRR